MAGKGQPKTGGRARGTPNKLTTALREAVLQAAEEAHEAGTVGYLKAQAEKNPVAFMTLLGKVLPTQLTGDGGGPIQLSHDEWIRSLK